MSRPSFPIIGTLILVAIGLTACGGNGQPAAGVSSAPGAGAVSGQPSAAGANGDGASAAATSAAKAPDPCTLLSDTEAAASLGGPATHKAGGSRDASNGNGTVVTENRCEWNLITSDQLGHDIWIAVYAGSDRTYYNQSASDHSTAIAGLGDAATGDSIHVWVFSKGVTLQIYGSVAADNGLAQIAALAIAKL